MKTIDHTSPEAMEAFENTIRLNLPPNSEITKAYTSEIRGSIYLYVEHMVSEEFQQQYDLWTRNRILSIRIIKAEGDEGLPILSFAKTEVAL